MTEKDSSVLHSQQRPKNDSREIMRRFSERRRIADEDNLLYFKENIGKINELLTQETAAKLMAEERAQTAEAEVATLQSLLKLERTSRELATLRLRMTPTNDSTSGLETLTTNQPDISATGLKFPYATKQLEAMRDASVKFWAEHDLSKPAPYGIQKQVQNFLASRTGENYRKVAELAAAIKPDDLPRT